MEYSSEHHEVDLLLSKLIEHPLDASEAEQLSALIGADRSLRRRYLEHCQMHALLRSEHGLLTAWSLADTTATAARRHLSWKLTALAIALAASLLLAFATVWWHSHERQSLPYRGDEVALLSKSVGAVFAYGPAGESNPAEGTPFRQGVYELQKGLVEFVYRSGAVLVVQAPATFELVDSASVRLEDGRVAAHVPQPAIGFRIESPGATVVDLGTDFAVQAVRDRESEVHVFKGEVRVDLHGSRGESSDPLRLVTGEATRVDFATGMPSGIDLDSQQFLRTLHEADTPYANAVMALHPAVYYRMEPTGDGSRLLDSSANGADATIHFGRATSPVWTAGKVGAALRLGGTTLQTYASAPAYPQATGDAMSVVGWVYASSRPRWASIAKNWAGGNDDRGQFHFGLYHDVGELEAHIVDDDGQEIIVRDKIPLPLNVWHHVAFVADGRELRLYRNGYEVDSKPYHKLHRDPRIRALAIGTKLNLAGNAPEEHDFNMWDGRLDELAVFNHALTSEQILNLYRLPGAIESRGLHKKDAKQKSL